MEHSQMWSQGTKEPSQQFLRNLHRAHKGSDTPWIFGTSGCGSPFLIQRWLCLWTKPSPYNCYQNQTFTLTLFTAKKLGDTRLLECFSTLYFRKEKSINLSIEVSLIYKPSSRTARATHKETLSRNPHPQKRLSKYLYTVRNWQNVKYKQILEQTL